MDEYLLQPPKDQLFYKFFAFMMGIFGMNSHHWHGFPLPKNIIYRIQRLIVITMVPVAAFSQVLYLVLYHSEHEFKSLSMMYAILPVTLAVMVKVGTAQTKDYRIVMEEFMIKIHLYNVYAKHKDAYSKKTLVTTEKLVRWSCILYMFLCYTAFVGFEIVPIVHNFQNNESMKNITTRLEIVVHIWLPFDYEWDYTNWIIVQIVTGYCCFIATTVVAIFDTANLTFVYHVIGHIKIFTHRIKTEFNQDGLTDEEVAKTITEISIQYGFIKQTLGQIQEAFGLNVASIYLHNLIGGGLFIYQISVSGTDIGTIVTYGVMIPLFMGVLVIMSFALEHISLAAEEMPNLVYYLRWEAMSVPNQKLLMMVLFQVQAGLEFKAAFNVKTGMEPALNIIKTAFSYYVMIKANM